MSEEKCTTNGADELSALRFSAKDILLHTYGEMRALKAIVENGLTDRIRALEGHPGNCAIGATLREHLAEHARVGGALSRADRIRTGLMLAGTLSGWALYFIERYAGKGGP